MKKILVVFACSIMVVHISYAQTDSLKSSLSLETRVTNYFQGGYEFAAFWNTKGNFSFGAQIAGQNIGGSSKETVFESSNHDELDIRITWLAAYKTRYHLRKHHEGFYGELSIGGEEFRIRSGNEEHKNTNGFILPSIGYIWHPWGRKGLYINPNIGYDFIIGRDDEKIINGTSYQLKSSFVVPAFSIGWKF